MTMEELSTKIDVLTSAVVKGFGQMATKADLEELAIMTAKGFEDVSNRFDGVDKKIEELDHKVDGLELKISSYASGWSRDFDRLHERMEELDKRVNKVEDKLVRK